jgi:hypothetical protein
LRNLLVVGGVPTGLAKRIAEYDPRGVDEAWQALREGVAAECNRLNSDSDALAYSVLPESDTPQERDLLLQIQSVAEAFSVPLIESRDIDIDSTEAMLNRTEGRIYVAEALSTGRKVSAVLHEIAHFLLHTLWKHETDNEPEVEAQAVTFIVARKNGLNIGPTSFTYIAMNETPDTDFLGAGEGRVRDASTALLVALQMAGTDELHRPD